VTSRASLRWAGALAAAGFLAGHLPFLVWFLDDIDPINFALGVRHYDIAHHQPHPPGYPIVILLGKLAAWGMSALGWHPHGDIEAGALAIWGIIGGALAAFPLALLFAQIELTGEPAATSDPDPNRNPSAPRRTLLTARAIGAMALTLACPLFWFTAGRPLSDVPGLAAALVAQALLAMAFARQGEWSRRRLEPGAGAVPSSEIVATGKLIVLGALLAGVAVGFRSQTAWLTLPVLALVIVDRAGRGAAGALLGSLFTFGIGSLLWFVPMVIATGGPSAYLAALTSQATEDFGGVDMLATSPEPLRRLLLNLIQTFIAPWSSVPLALVVLALAGVGLIVMAWRSRRGLAWLAAMALPYAVLHLLFQENETTRYALPLVPPVVYLAVRGAEALLRRASVVAVAALVIASLTIGAPALRAYAGGTSPIFHLFDDMSRTPVDAARPPVVVMHRRVSNESRRAREWEGAAFAWPLLPSTRGHEWLEAVKYWREGHAGPVWFIGDPRRTDLALIDSATRQHVRNYRWPVREASDPISRFFVRKLPQAFDDPAFVGGARPDEMDWYVFDRPGWFLGEGWALTPETSGVAQEDGKGPAQGGVSAYVRRRPDEARLLLGGRNLGAKGEPVARFTASLDGRVLDTWDVAPEPGFFLHALTLPAGALSGAGEYAELTVRAEAAPASGSGVDAQAQAQTRPVKASLEQFDLQSSSSVMFGYDTGWLEAEHNPRTGLSWRWASGDAALRIWSAGRDVTLRLRAESPLRYFSDAPIVTVRAGQRVLLTFPAQGDLDIAVDVPADALDAAGGVIAVTTDKTFSPAERQAGVTDRRRLGLRVFDLTITGRADASSR
jgi:hypothetical protein